MRPWGWLAALVALPAGLLHPRTPGPREVAPPVSTATTAAGTGGIHARLVTPPPVGAREDGGVDDGKGERRRTPSFSVGDTVRWHIDLAPAFPRGILCRQLQASLLPVLPPEPPPPLIPKPRSSPPSLVRFVDAIWWHGARLEQHRRHPCPEGAPLPEDPLPFHPILVAETAAWGRGAEVGLEYLLTFTLAPEHLVSRARRYQLSIACTPVPSAVPGSSAPPTPSREERGGPEPPPRSPRREHEVLALSEDFVIHDAASSSPEPREHGTLEDVSPLTFLYASSLTCPLSQERPRHPLRVGHHTYDRDVFLAYLALQANRDPENVQLMVLCPWPRALDWVCVDVHYAHRLQRVAEEEVAGLLQQRAAARSRAERSNLHTDHLLPVDLGQDGAGLSIGEFLAERELDVQLARVRARMSVYWGRVGERWPRPGHLLAYFQDEMAFDLRAFVRALASVLALPLLLQACVAMAPPPSDQPFPPLLRALARAALALNALPGDSLATMLAKGLVVAWLVWLQLASTSSHLALASLQRHWLRLLEGEVVGGFAASVRALPMPPGMLPLEEEWLGTETRLPP